MYQILAHVNKPIPRVMSEQGMLRKNGAARSITPGNEMLGALYIMDTSRAILLGRFCCCCFSLGGFGRVDLSGAKKELPRKKKSHHVNTHKVAA